MSASRILSLSSKLRSRVASGLLQRCGPSSRRIHSYYSESSRYSNESFRLGTKAPRLSLYDLLPAFFVGAGSIGVTLILHYIDERSAVRAGQQSSDCNLCLHESNHKLGPVVGGPFKLIDTEHRAVTEKSSSETGSSST